jgi:hypothetical protein
MTLTAIVVILTDFLTGVLTGLIVYALMFKFLDGPTSAPRHSHHPTTA